ncbi:unnamed protein product [Amoebophrya sp. A25]|nr:unnamed protein product [Amoebophrya sp. A25]|eukprot:GSA25T00001675001.1
MSTASRIIRDDDIKVWVEAAVDSAIPALEPTISSAFRKQEELVLQMLTTMDRNTQKMSETIANQGRLFICMGIAGFVIADARWSRWEKIGHLSAGIGTFFLLSKFLDWHNAVRT